MGSFVPFVRLSVRPLKPCIPSSVCQSIRPLLRPPFVSLILGLPAHSSVLPSGCFSLCLVGPSVRPPVLLPSTLLSVYPFVRSFPFLCQRLSICPSVHPVRRSDLSFWPSVRPSVCLSVFPNTYAFVLSFVRPSNHLSIYNGS